MKQGTRTTPSARKLSPSNLLHFTVSQLRVAATCPRLHWFDVRATAARKDGHLVVTRIWRKGANDSAAGTLFHSSIERFHRDEQLAAEIDRLVAAQRNPELLMQDLLHWFNEHNLDLDSLAKRPVRVREAFISAVQNYIRELASLLVHAAPKKAAANLFFGDNRKRVDVTFHVGDNTQVHVTGAVDYLYFDPRSNHYRIVDYKLAPATSTDSDRFQVETYALLHDHQHGTHPDVAVFYLHPTREVNEATWADIQREQHKVYRLIASLPGWTNHALGKPGALHPPGESSYCEMCPHQRSGACERDLGAKSMGEWDDRFATLPATRKLHPPPDTAIEVDREDESGDDAIDKPPTIKSFSADQIVLGQDSNGAWSTMDPRILHTHVSVVGAAGAGKTWMAKVIVEEAIRLQIPVIAIDPQGDIAQMMLMRDESEVPEDLRPLFRQFAERVEPRIFTPGTSHGIRLRLDPVRLPNIESLAGISDPALAAEEEESLLHAVTANLVSLCKVPGDSEVLATFVFKILRALPRKEPVQLSQIAAAVRDPEAFGMDDPDAFIPKSMRTKLAHKLVALYEGPSSRLLKDGVPLDLDAFVAPSTPGRVPLNIVYLNALSSDADKHFFLACFATELYRWMLTKGRSQLLFYIDEAKDWIPAGMKQTPEKEALKRLFAQGRKYGVGCLLCTQSPQSVDYNVFSNTSTKFIGRLESAQDVERVKEWFSTSGGAPDWVRDRNGAEKGSFVGRWPSMPEAWQGRAFKGRQLFTTHAGAWSPTAVETAVKMKSSGNS